MSRQICTTLLAFVAILAITTGGACKRTVTGPSQDGGDNQPTPVPGNPPGTPLQVDTYNGDFSLDDPAVCEPY